MKDIHLHKASNFFKRFEKHYRNSKTYKEAYHKTEQDFRNTFGENRYSSYNSFRNCYNKANR